MNKSAAAAHRERKELKAAYGAAYEGLRVLLRRADPIQLGPECPLDEYDAEVSTILPRLGACADSGDVARVLHEEFAKWFNPELAGPRSAYSALGNKVWLAMQRGWRAG